MEFLKLGTILSPFSLKGEIRIYSTTYFSSIRYKRGNIVYIKIDDEYKPFTVDRYHKNGKMDIVKLEEINSQEDAKALSKCEIFCEKQLFDDKDELYYFSDLENCLIYDEENNEIGKVIKVEEFPAQLTLRVVNKNGKNFFVPFVKEFIKKVDVINKKITIHLIEGML